MKNLKELRESILVNSCDLSISNISEGKVADGYMFATEKDVERVEKLSSKGQVFGYSPKHVVIKGIARMIETADKNKILGRFEAVFKKFGAQLSLPLALRLVELNPDTSYSKAYAEGRSDRTYMGTASYQGNKLEKMLYACGRSSK